MRFKPNKLLFRDSLLCTLLTIIVSGFLMLLIVNLSVLDPFYKAFKDFSFTDFYYSKSFKNKTFVKDVIIVNVEQSDRYAIAKAIEKIESQRPKVVGLDLVFKDLKIPYTDSILKLTLHKYNNIVCSFIIDGDSIIKNHKYFDNATPIEGFINLNLSNQEGVMRDFVGLKNIDNPEYSFAVQLAIQSGNIEKTQVLKLIDNIPINYTGGIDSFLNFDIDEILAMDNIPAIKNAIVIFGYLGTPTGNPFDIEDKHFTPLNKKYAGRSTPDMFGVLIQANIIKMITSKNFLLKTPKLVNYFFALLVCFFSIFFGMQLYKRSSLAFDILIKVLQLLITIIFLYLSLLLLKQNIYLSVTPILVLGILGLEMIDYYIHLLEYFKKRFKWQSYLLD